MIELQNLTKVYRMGKIEVPALRGVTLSINTSEMVAIMGASGSGKSTMMNILGCLDVPTSGQYLLDGEDVGRLADDRLAEIRNRKIGFVFQTYHLLPRLTALANVEMPLLYGNGQNRRQRAMDALKKVGLADRMNHRPAELSGGQQQRVGIARALVKDPTLLLADEPTGNLDTQSSEDIVKILQGLNHQEGLTVIIITHEADIATATRRIISMRDGQIIEDRPVSEAGLSLAAASLGRPTI
ncbi:MAG TPA: ABC transporter ATP-binding protein [Dehalococcoidia bacterium]|nr:ABC transporter ATP-binding protein [Dehalococcoidia bacterium]